LHPATRFYESGEVEDDLVNATGRTVEGGFHVGPELIDNGSDASLGEVSGVTVDLDNEELFDAERRPHGLVLQSFGKLGTDLGSVSGEVDSGVDLISAVDVNQVIDAVNPVEDLGGRSFTEETELVDTSNASGVDAVSIKQKGLSGEVAFGLADASGTKDGLEGGFELKAVSGGEHCLDG